MDGYGLNVSSSAWFIFSTHFYTICFFLLAIMISFQSG
jgi:hypothetical protein